MEKREVPPIIFTLLARDNPRFILNEAGVRPVNVFHLIYPKLEIVKNECVEILWALLNSQFSMLNLREVGRKYGGNTIKIEPRELDNLLVFNRCRYLKKIKSEIKNGIKIFKTDRNTQKFLNTLNHIIDNYLKEPRQIKKPISYSTTLPQIMLFRGKHKIEYSAKLKQSKKD